MSADSRPYLVNRFCDRCILPLEISERREGSWLFVTYSCGRCGFRQVVSFSPAELAEWERRRKRWPRLERDDRDNLPAGAGGRDR
jgi:hypothetical protein